MTSTNLQRLLLAGEALFLLLVAWLLHRAGVGTPAVVLIVVAMALAGRAVMVGWTFLLSRLGGSPVPAGERAGFVGWLRMLAVEYGAFVALFSVVQPLERWFMKPDKLEWGAGGRLPVLLVHGYQANRAFWRWQRRRLEKAGWPVATVDLQPAFASIDRYAQLIHLRIEEIRAETGATQVILVGHSMGGMAARAYLRDFGAGRVAKLITLGSPHRGTRLAVAGIGANARQMEPRTVWLASLEKADRPAAVTSIMSRYDNFVIPQDCAILADARNVVLKPIGHLGMAVSSDVTAALLAEIESTG